MTFYCIKEYTNGLETTSDNLQVLFLTCRGGVRPSRTFEGRNDFFVIIFLTGLFLPENEQQFCQSNKGNKYEVLHAILFEKYA